MSDTVLVSIIGGMFALAQIVTLWLLNKTHKAVNSTAKALADQKLIDDAKAQETAAELNRLRGIVEAREH